MGAGCNQIPDLSAIACKRALRLVRTWPFFTSPRLVYRERASAEFLAVQRHHGGFGLGLVVHGDERKAARFASHAVHHQRDFADLAVLFEKILEIVFGGLKREITNV